MAAQTDSATDFLVAKTDLHKTTLENNPLTALADGEVRLKVDRFAFTANNVTYAAFGDHMKYWHFFPAPEGWGRIPVWGFADVIESQHPDVTVGTRFYGYYPMSSHLTVAPEKVTAAGFTDGAKHRAGLPPVYNYYNNCETDPGYAATMEDLQMIFRPLFMTSFLIDDFMADNAFFGAKRVILSSASSKTAYGAAFQLAKRDGLEVVGLTSPGNIAFVDGMGSYDRVLSYDDVAALDASVPSVYIDMAGSGAVRRAVHTHIADNLKYSCAVGASHWDEMGSNEELPGATPTLFFAPAQGQKRVAEWGAEGFQQASAAAWVNFIKPASGWTQVKRHAGQAAIEDIYRLMLDGNANPRDGHILSF